MLLLLINSFIPKNINKVVKLRQSDISKIYLLDGNNGHIVTLEDEARIKKFIDYIDDYRIQKNLNQISSKGFSYSATILYKDETETRIILGSRMKINKTYYKVVKPSFSMDTIKKLAKGMETYE